eukprot:TRINITY_DN14626_c0_g2_i2.p1 TRINITY_DN14626_c0_g2~~TRINITY_DN14626_c0_g2_i2.p1  ORF type:complete len:426 (+),score=103.13 TRINITY_DN14626_c0_g2_i2:110-1279(+)
METMTMELLKKDPNIIVPHRLETITREMIKAPFRASAELWETWACGLEAYAQYKRSVQEGSFHPPLHLEPSLRAAAWELMGAVKSATQRLQAAVKWVSSGGKMEEDPLWGKVGLATPDWPYIPGEAAKATPPAPVQGAEAQEWSSAAEASPALPPAHTLAASATGSQEASQTLAGSSSAEPESSLAEGASETLLTSLSLVEPETSLAEEPDIQAAAADARTLLVEAWEPSCRVAADVDFLGGRHKELLEALVGLQALLATSDALTQDTPELDKAVEAAVQAHLAAHAASLAQSREEQRSSADAGAVAEGTGAEVAEVQPVLEEKAPETPDVLSQIYEEHRKALTPAAAAELDAFKAECEARDKNREEQVGLMSIMQRTCQLRAFQRTQS